MRLRTIHPPPPSPPGLVVSSCLPACLPALPTPSPGNWREIKYRGDPMLRPIASYELSWLVRFLVRLSQAINATLGLTAEPQPPPAEPPETILQVSGSVAHSAACAA